MLFIPIRTDRRQHTTPWVNYTLIALNILIFGLTYQHVIAFEPLAAQGNSTEQIIARAPAVGYWLWPTEPYIRLYQFLTYQFLHVGWEHILFNMLFLYVFGNAVEDRLGKVGYLLFYLAGGVVAGVGHTLASGAPVLGASGSVAAVTGAYLALSPLSNVTIFYWVIVMIGSFEVSSMILILFRIVQDLIFQVSGIDNTAYVAHLAGYAYGFVVGMALLLGRLLTREPYDMLSLINQKRRRSQFKRLSRGGYSPWDHAGSGSADTPSRRKRTPDEPSADDRKLMDERAAISDAVAAHDSCPGRPPLRRPLAEAPRPGHGPADPARPRQPAHGRRTLRHRRPRLRPVPFQTYPNYPQKPHIQLILGLILARYLQQPDRARTLLTESPRPPLRRRPRPRRHRPRRAVVKRLTAKGAEDAKEGRRAGLALPRPFARRPNAAAGRPVGHGRGRVNPALPAVPPLASC